MVVTLTEAEAAALRALVAPKVTRDRNGVRVVPVAAKVEPAPRTRESLEAEVYNGGGCGWCSRKVTAATPTMTPVGTRVVLPGVEFHICQRCQDPATRASDVYDAALAAVGRDSLGEVEPADLEAAVLAHGAAWSSFASPRSVGGRRPWSHVRDWPTVVATSQRLHAEREAVAAERAALRCLDCGMQCDYRSPRLSPVPVGDGVVCRTCNERRAVVAERMQREQRQERIAQMNQARADGRRRR
jgi:hypothetical protein